MLNWNDEIAVLTGAEAKMLGVSLETFEGMVECQEVQQALQNPVISTKALEGVLAWLDELLMTRRENAVVFSRRSWHEAQRLAVIFRRWVGERRVRFLNSCRVVRLVSLNRHTTRSAAANMRLVAPIGAPPQFA